MLLVNGPAEARAAVRKLVKDGVEWVKTYPTGDAAAPDANDHHTLSMTFEEASAHFEDASEHFGSTFLATRLAADVPVSSDLTRALLGWEPPHESLLEDLRFGDYITGPLSQP